MKCGRCGQPGHNSRSCNKTSADRLSSKASYMRRYRARLKASGAVLDHRKGSRGLGTKNDRLLEGDL